MGLKRIVNVIQSNEGIDFKYVKIINQNMSNDQDEVDRTQLPVVLSAADYLRTLVRGDDYTLYFAAVNSIWKYLESLSGDEPKSRPIDALEILGSLRKKYPNPEYTT